MFASFGSIFYSILLILLADFGDKTWALIAAFAVWCPWCGLRDRGALLMSTTYSLILVGCTGSLMARCFLLAVNVDPFQWDFFNEIAAVVMLVVFGVRATIDWRSVVAGNFVRRENEGFEAQPAMPLKPTPKTSLQDDPESVAAGYGATGSSPPGTAEWLKAPPEGWPQALLTALVLPMFTVLFVEAGDRSQGVLVITDWGRLDITLGAMIGFIVSCLGALLFGHAVRWKLSEAWLLFFVATTFWVVCFCSVRDAMLHMVLGTLLPTPTVH